MAFATSSLLLTADREAQLKAALENDTEDDPLATICAEAEARVTEEIGDLEVDESVTNSLIRAIALWQAYTIAEGPLPDDIKFAYEEALKFLEQLRTGEVSVEGSALVGSYGGDAFVEPRA